MKKKNKKNSTRTHKSSIMIFIEKKNLESLNHELGWYLCGYIHIFRHGFLGVIERFFSRTGTRYRPLCCIEYSIHIKKRARINHELSILVHGHKRIEWWWHFSGPTTQNRMYPLSFFIRTKDRSYGNNDTSQTELWRDFIHVLPCMK